MLSVKLKGGSISLSVSPSSTAGLLRNAYFALEDYARTWFENHEVAPSTWIYSYIFHLGYYDVNRPCCEATAGEARIIVDRKALTNCALEKLDPKEKGAKTLGAAAADLLHNAFIGTPSFLLGLFPILSWLRTYNLRTFLLPDVLGGLSTVVINVPQGLVLAIIAGVDPALGLYSTLYPALVYVIMGTSPYVSMGMVPVSALMTGVVVKKYSVVSDNGTLVENGVDEFSMERSPADVAITLTLLCGLIQVGLWLLRLDRLAAIISPVTGEAFLSGCSLVVIISQLASVFGVDVKPTQGLFGTPQTLYHVSKSVSRSNLATSLLSLASFVVLILAKGVIARKIRRFTAIPLPSDLLLVAAATLSSHFLELDTKHNVRVVGHITPGFPMPRVPSLNQWTSLLPDAAAIAIVQFVVTYTMAELFGRKRRLKTDASQEMLAYGMSCVVGSFFMSLPAGSSLSRSVVLKDVGARTQVSGLVSSVFVALTLYTLSSLFRPVPECVLAVLIIVVLLPMVFKLRNLPMLWRISRFDFVLWSLSFLSPVFLNATYGLMAGILLGLLIIFLELSGQKGSRLQPRKPDVFVASKLTPEENRVIIYRFSGPLCFATHHNIVADILSFFKRSESKIEKGSTTLQAMEEAAREAATTRAIVMDCSAISFIDSSGLRALGLVVDMCRENKCALYLASLQDTPLKVIKTQESMLQNVGIEHITPTVQDAVALANCQLPARIYSTQLQTYL
ncbi:solute carrier family 26 member 10-like [Dermacentor albipictus]|uniref:solute carrier family 26 member 10-like n=1 Tax=Dermacentor albipictus TaxID=60249 RepID=UPI0038FBFDE4